MAKYLIKRILHGIVSIIAVVILIMVLVYVLGNRELIFGTDSNFQHQINNSRTTYMYQKWEDYGYLDYIPIADWLNQKVTNDEMDAETRSSIRIGDKADGSADTEVSAQYIEEFTSEYQSKGYKIMRLDAIRAGRGYATGGQPAMFAYKDKSIVTRVWNYFTSIFVIDNIHYVEDNYPDYELDGEAGLTFTLYDPVYGGDTFSPALIGNGTNHRYLIYFTDKFPYIHQNILTIQLGTSYTVNQGVDVYDTMTKSQGSYKNSTITYPTGLVEESADDLHSAKFSANSLDTSLVFADRYIDDYTNVDTNKTGMSKMGYSFTIGIMSVIMAYALGLPLGLLMANKKDKLVDKLGTIYIIFIIAVPSLAYIFIFRAVGGALGLPTLFDMDSTSKLIYVLPVVSLALPSVANLMKWMRRYMIDQQNSDYVKFARSGGLSEGEIFSKHIMKNAIIPIVHGIPSSIIGCLTGAIITERVYVVPGAGGLLTLAINNYDNSVIVGVAMFYAILSVVGVILGDILMGMVDPRISFSDEAR